jgi:hypothetical protein
MNSWLRKRVLVFTGTLYLWDIDGRIAKAKQSNDLMTAWWQS